MSGSRTLAKEGDQSGSMEERVDSTVKEERLQGGKGGQQEEPS